ncbi:MAG TPA: TonB-dependent receptor [Candidatus Sulfotelmatobacter sp.]|nr:TonB-dependent receptor [Candidatus Sulfotelmatobacter sp.]
MQSYRAGSNSWRISIAARIPTILTILTLLALTLMWSTLAVAQHTTGALRGQVLDPAGAAVVAGKVSLTNEATGVQQTTATSSAGTFEFPSVLPGSYTISIESPSFKKFMKTGIRVLANQDNVADARLDIGATSEVVEVVAGTSGVQTASSDLTHSFSSQEVVDLPSAAGVLNGSPLNLAILTPNVVATPGGAQGVGGAVGGLRPRDNNFNVDGVDDNNLGVTGNNSTVIPDAVSEFAVQTNQFSAEYGHSAGGQFSLITKTGTNRLHGSGEWYLQNRNFNSLDNITKQQILSDRAANPPVPGSLVAMPAYDNNRFGGTIGGPILKDKLFFFGAYEYTTIHGAGPPTSLGTAPTAAGLSMLQGLAADSAVSAALADFPVAPSATTTVDVNGTAVPVGPLSIIAPNFQREHDIQFNMDYTRGHHQFGTRFTFNQEKFILPGSIPIPVWNQNEPIRNRKVALTDTWTARSNVVNDLRLQYSYYSLGLLDPCKPGVTCQPDITLGDLYLGNTTGVADNQTQKQNSYQLRDALTWVHGKHTFKFGGEYNHFIYPQFFLPRSVGDYEYSTTANFIQDQVPDARALRNAGSGFFLGTQSLMAGFAQDDFKVTPRLTLNLGVRYEFWTNPVGDKEWALNAISNVPGVITFANPNTDSNNIAPRVGFAYDPSGSGKTSIRGGFGVSYDVRFQNFDSISLPPQLQSELNNGSACTLTPTPSWCSTQAGFLAGGGLPQTYIPPADQATARNLTSAHVPIKTVLPKVLSWSLGVQHEVYRNALLEVRYVGTRGLELPVQNRLNFITYFDAGGSALPTYLSPSSIPSSYSASTPTDTNFYLFENNFFNQTLNPVPGLTQPSPDIYQQYGFFGFATEYSPLASSIYHAGSISFTQNSRHGLTLNANYTYSHTIDDATNEFHTSALNPRRAQDNFNIGADRANSDLDVPHKGSVALVYHLPTSKSLNGIAKAFLNGYQVGTVFYAQSGQPVTLQSGVVDSNGNVDTAGDRVVMNPNGTGNVLGENLQGDVFPVCEGTGGATYVGTTSFLNAPLNGCNKNLAAPLGYDPAIGYTPANSNDRYVLAGNGAKPNVGRNSFRTPGFTTFNLSISKNTYFGETKYLQLRADVFNVLNHPSYTLTNGNVFNAGGIATALANPGYAQPFSSGFLNPKEFGGGIRQMTLGLKFIF